MQLQQMGPEATWLQNDKQGMMCSDFTVMENLRQGPALRV